MEPCSVPTTHLPSEGSWAGHFLLLGLFPHLPDGLQFALPAFQGHWEAPMREERASSGRMRRRRRWPRLGVPVNSRVTPLYSRSCTSHRLLVSKMEMAFLMVPKPLSL